MYTEVRTVNAQELLDLIEDYEYQANIFIAPPNISLLTDADEADEDDICTLNDLSPN